MKINKINKKVIFAIFLILQPFLDCYYLYTDKVINFFGFSPTTIIRVLVVLIFSLLLFFDKKNNKSRIPLIIYFLTIIIYVVFHHFISTSIDSNLIYKTLKYNIVEEAFYIVRIILPILTIYIVYSLNYTKDEVKKIIFYTSLSVCAICISLNLFKIALSSYGSKQILGNIFDWLKGGFSRTSLASKGWFNSANQISGLILILIPTMLYYSLQDKKKSDLIILLLLILSSYMIGTRVSTIGMPCIIIFLIIAYFIFKKVSSQKIILREKVFLSIILVFTLFIFNYAPIVNCSGSNYRCIFNLQEESQKRNLNNIDIEKYKNLVFDGNTCAFLPLTPTNKIYYEELYPCEDNLTFWTDYSKNKTYLYIDNRLMQKMVTEDIYNKIENVPINLFGMSRSRFLSAEIYYEKDIIVHFYTLGIIGVILLIFIPYILPCIRIFFTKLKYKKLKYFDFTLICASASVILASFLSGHIIDELIVMLYLGFIIGVLLKNNDNSDNIIDKVLIVNDERITGGVSILLEDILNKIDKDIKIDLLILHNNGTRLKNLPHNVKIIYGNKFFSVVDLPLKEAIKSHNIISIIRKLNLIFLMKTGLIKYKIKNERNKILEGSYQQEIAFKDGFCGLFVAYGNSPQKIQWIHSDYATFDSLVNYRKLFIKEFNNFNKIVAVSKPVADNFNKIYGQKDKTIVIKNLIDVDRIISLSKEKVQSLHPKSFNLISIGRLHRDKGFQNVIEVLNKLNNEKLLDNVFYTIIGEGNYRENLEELIQKYNLCDKVQLLGKKDNPYPYLKQSDLFILSSFHESFGLVVVEALTLGIPVVAVKVASINMLLDKKHGEIIDNNLDSLYNEIKDVIINRKKVSDWKKNLEKYKYDNESTIKKINELLGSKL